MVNVEVARGVARLRLDSPDNRNALSEALLADFARALDRAEAPDVRVVVVDHCPPAFCAGADLRHSGPALATDSDGLSPMARIMSRLFHLRTPTIAALNGPVRAGGIGLMACCDLVVVNPAVDFAFTEVRIGVAPAIISVPILARVGWSAVASSWLTGERFDAEEARRMGLVTHVSDDVAATVATLCDGIARGGPGAVQATKALLRRGAAHHFDAALVEMSAQASALFASAEAREGMAAFFAKRLPSWIEQV